MEFSKEQSDELIEFLNDNFNLQLPPSKQKKFSNTLYVIALVAVTFFTLGGYYTTYTYTKDKVDKLEAQFDNNDKELESARIQMAALQQRQTDMEKDIEKATTR